MSEAEDRIEKARCSGASTLGLNDLHPRALPDSLRACTTLTELHLDGNALTALPDSMQGLTELVWLNLTGNPLSKLPRLARNVWTRRPQLLRKRAILTACSRRTCLSDHGRESLKLNVTTPPAGNLPIASGECVDRSREDGRMGQRANFALVEDTGWSLYFNKWAAAEMSSVLIAGPGPATRYIRRSQLCADRQRGGWLDDVWAEGGAVVDHLTHQLVFFGAGDEAWDVVRKRALIQLLGLTWQGWRIRWAYDGIGDLAAHVGVDSAIVRNVDEEERILPKELQTDFRWPCHLLTVHDRTGELTAYPLSEDCHTAWQGPDLLKRLPGEGLTRLELPELPTGGLHLDVTTRTAGVWLANTSTGLVPALTTLWPGWHVHFWEDRYEEQAHRSLGTVTFPPNDPAAGLDRLLPRDQPWHLDSAEWTTVLRTAARLRIHLATNQGVSRSPRS